MKEHIVVTFTNKCNPACARVMHFADVLRFMKEHNADVVRVFSGNTFMEFALNPDGKLYNTNNGIISYEQY